jgi:4-hydroxy-2-oxoheptanedioate aldolase
MDLDRPPAVVEAAAAGVPVGTLTVRPADVDDRVKRGFDYQIAGKDTTTLIETGERIREEYTDSLSRQD